MVNWRFEKLVAKLRIKIRISGLEDDEYIIIIRIENFILHYGSRVADDSYTALAFANEDETLQILKDILQTNKSESDLFIYAEN